MKKAGVIGYPISHSLSPRIHGFWIKKHGLDATYEAIAVPPAELKHFLKQLPEKGFTGVNVTIPHKEEAFKLVDRHEGAFTQKIAAVNTVIVDGKKLIGTNTDGYGFYENIKHKLSASMHKALVIGSGGATRAVALALLEAGYRVTLINRTHEKAVALARQLNDGKVKVLPWEEIENAMHDVSLLVNTTSLGMKGQPALDISLNNLPEDAVVNDIVYTPLMTPLLEQAKDRGNVIVDGLGMLLYQAQMAFKIWFGIMPEVTDELRQYVLQGMK